MTPEYVKDPTWVSGRRTAITGIVKWQGAAGEVPFTASLHDPEAHGAQLFSDLVAGVYGPVSEPPQQATLTPFTPQVDPVQEAAYRIRNQRNSVLQGTDYKVLPFLERGETPPAEWVAYRQALRDLPQQAGFPNEVQWPQRPTQAIV